MIKLKITRHEWTECKGRGRNSDGWSSQQNFITEYEAYVNTKLVHEDDLLRIRNYCNSRYREYYDDYCEYIFDPINSVHTDYESAMMIISTLAPDLYMPSDDADVVHKVGDVLNERYAELRELDPNLSPKEWLLNYFNKYIYYDAFIKNTFTDRMPHCPTHLYGKLYPIDMAIYLDDSELLYKYRGMKFSHYKNFDGLLRMLTLSKDEAWFEECVTQNKHLFAPSHILRLMAWTKQHEFTFGYDLIYSLLPEEVKQNIEKYNAPEHLKNHITYTYTFPNINLDRYTYSRIQNPFLFDYTRYMTDANRYIQWENNFRILYDDNEVPFIVDRYFITSNHNLYKISKSLDFKDKKTLIDKNGDNVLGDKWYDEIKNLYEPDDNSAYRKVDQLLRVKTEKGWQIITREGELISYQYFDHIDSRPHKYDREDKDWYKKNLIRVTRGGKTGFVGSADVNCFFDRFYGVKEVKGIGVHAAYKDGELYFITNEGLIFKAIKNFLDREGKPFDIYI